MKPKRLVSVQQPCTEHTSAEYEAYIYEIWSIHDRCTLHISMLSLGEVLASPLFHGYLPAVDDIDSLAKCREL